MSRQPSIENYFKSKSSQSTCFTKLDPNSDMDSKNITVKRRNLSLIKPTTPTKNTKICDENIYQSDVINLCTSDEEDIWDNTPKMRSPCLNQTQRSSDSEGAVSDCSTIIYSPAKSFLSPTTPRKQQPMTPKKDPLATQKPEPALVTNDASCSNQKSIQIQIKTESLNEIPGVSFDSFQTPKKSPHSSSTLQNSVSSCKSSQSKEKFFSPVRKRSIAVRPANKAKRRLSIELSKSIPSRILFEDDLFANACEGMDDKTIFLLKIIDKYLNAPSLKQLLDTESQTLLTNCLQVVKPGMRLVCRLYWRKEGFYKKDQVIQICSEDTATIDEENFQEMMTSLVENGLVVQSRTQNITFDHFVSILKKDDLKDICKELKMNISSKQDAIEALRRFSKRSSNISNFFTGHTSSNSTRVLQMMSNKAGPCYKLSDLARSTLYKLYILMYLGMDYSIIREKKLELTLIYDKIRRETYPVDKEMVLDDASVVFKTKDKFDRYLTAHYINEDFLNSTDTCNKCKIVKQVYQLYKGISEEEMESYKSVPQWLLRYTPASIYVRILESGVQELKRDKQESHYDFALAILDLLIGQNLFRQHRKAEWFAEKALILHTCLSRSDEAAEVLLGGFQSDLPEEDKEAMRPRARKIAAQKNITLSDELRAELKERGTKNAILENDFESKHIEKQPMERSTPRGKQKFETRTAEGRLVQEAEEYCIARYICTGEFTHGEHWEGRIVEALFFLLFWDIIYSKPAGARGIFLSHYQQYPLDMFTDSFYTNRKEAIDNWLLVIETASESKLLQIMHDTWNNRPEHELSGLSWARGAARWEQVCAVAACAGGARLGALCRRLARRYRRAAGFPDLTLWHATTRQLMFVEVKTDSDKPSGAQLQWLAALRCMGVRAGFCYVGARTDRQRARQPRKKAKGKPNKSSIKGSRVYRAMFAVYVPLVFMSMVSALSVIYLYCIKRLSRKGYMDVKEKPADDGRPE